MDTLKSLITTATLLFAMLFNPLAAQLKTDLAPFEAVKILGFFEVDLIKSDEERIEISAWGIDEEDVKITQYGRTLKIGTLKSLTKEDVEVKIKLYYRDINTLQVAGGARLEAEQVIEADDFFLRGGSGSEIYLEFAVRELDINAAEGAHLTILGAAEELEVSATTGGILDGHRLEGHDVIMRAGTGGEVSARVTGRLDAKANTGGVIRYAGTPESVNRRTILGGEIHSLRR